MCSTLEVKYHYNYMYTSPSLSWARWTGAIPTIAVLSMCVPGAQGPWMWVMAFLADVLVLAAAVPAFPVVIVAEHVLPRSAGTGLPSRGRV